MFPPPLPLTLAQIPRRISTILSPKPRKKEMKRPLLRRALRSLLPRSGPQIKMSLRKSWMTISSKWTLGLKPFRESTKRGLKSKHRKKRSLAEEVDVMLAVNPKLLSTYSVFSLLSVLSLTTRFQYALDLDPPQKKSGQTLSDAESAYGSEHISDGSGSESEVDAVEEDLLAPDKSKKGKSRATLATPFPVNAASGACGLCGQSHGPGNCPMTEASENLVEYREMLIMHAGDETYEHRVSYSLHSLDNSSDQVCVVCCCECN